MPTAGTHITIIERLALDPTFAGLLGDPHADRDDDQALVMRFAKLGAVGPDLFYAMADYGPELQDLVNFLSKLAGSVECMLDIAKKADSALAQIESDLTAGGIDQFKLALNEIESLFALVSSTVTDGLIAVAINNGLNFWPIFEARRQLDQPRERWFWADYLHYVRSGEFVRQLFNHSRGNPYHTAYAMGYLSHYVTDVVGHPFVNMVVGGPWRAYWQRHHVVENFIDAHVWDRWHESRPAPAPPSTDEQPLDSILDVPHAAPGQGAPMTYARINDHINIGVDRGNDPVDRLIHDICDRIDRGMNDIGLAEPTPDPPAAAEFADWTQMVEAAFRAAYPPASIPPENLKGSGRADGYPTADDIAAAYSVLRLYLRTTTEQGIREPEFPNVAADVWNAVKKTYDDLVKDLGAVPPIPLPAFHGGGFSWQAIWESICDWVTRVARFAVALGKAAIDLIRNAITVVGVLTIDLIKMGLYLVKKALFDLYQAFRHFLVRAGYAIPNIDELTGDVGGGVPAESLWNTRNNDDRYPMAELPDLEEPMFGSHYAPWVPVRELAEMQAGPFHEQPFTWPGPYANASPEAFIDGPLGEAVMLAPDGPVDLTMPPDQLARPRPSFGGAIANCQQAFTAVAAALVAGDLPEGFFPNYNLDGDRGYAWPCWDVDRANHPADAQLWPKNAGQSPTVAAIAIN